VESLECIGVCVRACIPCMRVWIGLLLACFVMPHAPIPHPCILQDSDLVILDFAVNDGHTSPNGRDKLGYSFTGGARRGFEQLVRLLMAACGGRRLLGLGTGQLLGPWGRQLPDWLV